MSLVSRIIFTLDSMCELGFLLDFISGPVSVGFTSAASIIIATSQVKDILGLKVTGTKFVQVWQSIFEHIGETRRWDTALGIVCIIVLLLLRVRARHYLNCTCYFNNTRTQSKSRDTIYNRAILFRLHIYYSLYISAY